MPLTRTSAQKPKHPVASPVRKARTVVKGVILDRGFATQDVLDLIRAKGLDYIVMLKKNLAGFTSMLERHGKEVLKLFANGVAKKGIVSGIVDKEKVFQKSDVESYIALYYSAKNNSKRTADLFIKAMDALDAAKESIAKGEEVSFPKEIQELFSLEFTSPAMSWA